MRLLPIFLLLATSLDLHAAPLRKDYQGQTFDLARPRRTVASTFVGADEILIALFAAEPSRIAALSPLARDPRYSSVTTEAQRWPSFGDEIESLIKLKPDIVITARYTRPEWIRSLKLAKVETFVLGDFSSIDDIEKNIEVIGALLQIAAPAQKLLKSFRERMAHAKKDCKISGKKILNYDSGGLLLGKNTTFNSIINYLNAENLAASLGIEGWTMVSQERILTLRPGYVLVAGMPKDKGDSLKKLQNELPWQHLKAVKEGKIIMVPAPQLSSVSHHIAQAMESICAGL